mmetsp:Transcript_36429/g.102697  ORF Transcript_36429/g.102697 Transcript_36429/m.102697 type:complete len:310 (+) Transcript_36429:621-1550(+)
MPGKAHTEGLPVLHDPVHPREARALPDLGEEPLRPVLRPRGRGQPPVRPRGRHAGLPGAGDGRRRGGRQVDLLAPVRRRHRQAGPAQGPLVRREAPADPAALRERPQAHRVRGPRRRREGPRRRRGHAERAAGADRLRRRGGLRQGRRRDVRAGPARPHRAERLQQGRPHFHGLRTLRGELAHGELSDRPDLALGRPVHRRRHHPGGRKHERHSRRAGGLPAGPRADGPVGGEEAARVPGPHRVGPLPRAVAEEDPAAEQAAHTQPRLLRLRRRHGPGRRQSFQRVEDCRLCQGVRARPSWCPPTRAVP